MKPSKRARYQIRADRDGLQLDIDGDFWNETIADEKSGSTYLDIHISQVVQEIRAALYFVAADGSTRH